jgi:transcriptional regulator GlxA family with amidase domain
MAKRYFRRPWIVGGIALGVALVAAGGIARRLSPARAADTPAAEAAKQYTKNVAIVIYEGAEILDFAGPAEVFAAASGFGSNQGRPAFKVYTVATSREPITSQGFVKIIPEYTIDDAPAPDLVVIPGGSADSLIKDQKFMAWAKGAVKDADVTLTVCTGAFVLARAGLLDGLHATTWYNAIGRLREAAPKATVEEGRRFVDAGAIITTAGVSAGIDGALHTVARLLGRNVADRTARYMQYAWTPEPGLSQGYSYLNPSLDDRGRALQEAAILEDAKDHARAEKAYRALVEESPNDSFSWYRLGRVLHVQGKLDDAIEANQRAAASPEMRPKALYNMACEYALKGATDDALDRLQKAVDAGFKEKWHLENDTDLASLRQDARFQRLVEAALRRGG